MKIFAVVGSMRNGNTEFLVDSMVDAIQDEQDVEIEKILLRNMSISFCDGCLICDETSRCVKNDDMTDIADEARSVDGFIFASPARWSLLSGEMKTFFDRLNPLAVNEELSGKFAVAVSVGQSEEDDRSSIDNTIKSIEDFCINAGITVVNHVGVCGCYSSGDAKDKDSEVKKCRNVALELVNAIKKA